MTISFAEGGQKTGYFFQELKSTGYRFQTAIYMQKFPAVQI